MKQFDVLTDGKSDYNDYTRHSIGVESVTRQHLLWRTRLMMIQFKKCQTLFSKSI